MNRSSSIVLVILALALSGPWADVLSAQRKQWVQLTDCRYLDHDYNDGDSFYVHCGAAELIVRLYFVDAPETNLRHPERVHEQSEYFGITLDDTLRSGKQATTKVQETLHTPFTVWTRWASVGGRTKVPRYYGFVEVGEQDLAEILVSQGLARTKGVTAASPKGEPSRTMLQKLQSLEQQAQQQRRGAWAKSSAGATQDPR